MSGYIKEDLDRAVDVLKQGGVILYPTDTVWGLGCDATNSEAVARIFDIKRRSDAKAMLMLVDSDGRLQQYVDDIPDIAWQLIDVAVNPLTIIYDRPRGISSALLAEDGSAGFRITHEPFSAALCRRLRHPVVSTSANISGRPTPPCFDRIDPELLEKVDYVVKYGRRAQPARPSNIIKIKGHGEYTIIR